MLRLILDPRSWLRRLHRPCRPCRPPLPDRLDPPSRRRRSYRGRRPATALRGAVAAAAAVAATALLAACDVRTAGAPTGGLELSVVLPDAQHLVPGHAVRIADVRVGTVTAVELDGYRARVRFTVAADRPIPEGTVASLSQTSLLGENYVRLELPEGFDGTTGPFVADGAELPSAASPVDPSLESVTQHAIELLGAIEGGDLTSIVEALAGAAGGRGPLLNRMIVQLSDLGTVFADQAGDLDAALAGLAELGDALAAGDAAPLEQLAADLAAAGETLARQRDRFVETLTRITDLGVALDDVVVGRHGAELDRILSQLDDVAHTLAESRGTLGELLEHLAVLSERAPRAGDGVGGILFYGWITAIALPGDVAVPTSALELLLPPGAEAGS